MRKISILLSILVLAAMVLTACGGEQTATNLPSTAVPPTTAEATEAMTEAATESPTDATTETPGVPVTGDVNPASLSNQLDFTVSNQDGEQIGEVNDMVLDLDNTRVAYVVVGTGGFLDLDERDILVPWNCLQLQAGTGDATGGQQNAFILQTDMDTFRNAPDFDLTANLPQMGQPAADWDADIRDWCVAGGTTTTPSAQGTAAPDTTATGTGPDTGTAQATATSGTGQGQATATAGTGTGQGTGQATATASTGGTGQATATAGTGTAAGATAPQGVVLASEILGATVNLGAQGTGTGQGQATATAGAGTGQGTAPATEGVATATGAAGQGAGQATATAGTGATAESTATAGTGGTGTDQGVTTATIEDMIIDTDAGDILFIVINAAFTDGERFIPVPLGVFQWDSGTQAFILGGDAAMLQNAPFLPDGQFPDMTTADWSSEFEAFWQNNGAGGSGSGGGATATATPTP